MKVNIRMFSTLALIISMMASSCLKDKDFDNGSIQSVHSTGDQIKVIEIKLTATSNDNFLSYNVDNSDNDTTVDLIPIVLATGSPAATDIHVTLTQNDALVTQYNEDNGTEFEIPTNYTLVSQVVTIPKGSNTGYLQIKFKPSEFVGKEYAVGYSLNKVDEAGYVVSGNHQDGIVLIGVKNKYDGTYDLNLTTTGWAAYGISDGPSKDYGSIGLITSGAGGVTLSTGTQPAFDDGGGVTGFGATQPLFVFDPATDALIDVRNLVPDDGRGRAFKLDPAVTDRRFDPATRTIYASYIMTQNGRPPQYIKAIFTYTGPR